MKSIFILNIFFIFSFLCHSFILNDGGKKKIKSVEDLGEKLFFDPILSRDNTISCASCHKPEFAFGDNVPVSFGVDSAKGVRNTPPITNLSDISVFFWDGRANSLEEQAWMPVEHPDEMALHPDSAVARLNADKEYSLLFRKLFKSPATKENVSKALAAFEKTLETFDTPFDKWMRGIPEAMKQSAIRGRDIFMEKGKCFDCHFGPDFTGEEFRNIGLFNAKDFNDQGRYEITKDSSDIGKFKVPGLRNIEVTAPYMHNGIFNTLREVIEFYNEPEKFVKGSINTDPLMKEPIGLSEEEINDLEEFLKALTDERFKK
jgi:cytochrome c peroxidase